MATFSRTPQTRALDRSARLQTMLDMPFTLGRNLAEQAGQGILDSFGLGTVVRQSTIPQGNTAPDMGGAVPNPIASLGRLAQNAGAAVRQDEPQVSMSEDEYKASPYYRTDIPFDPGMTEDRAASLAAFYDQKKVREYFGSKRPISTFIGQFAGQALDPINYIPVFGQASEAAAVARLGTIGGRLLVGSSDAAINTAAFGVMSAGLREEFGDDVSWQAMTNEIAMSALIGGVFSGVAPLVRSAWNATAGRSARAAEAQAANDLLDIRSLKESRAVLNEAVGSLAETGDVNLSVNSQAIADRVVAEVTSRATAVRALDVETASINTSQPVAITPSGQRVNVMPEVVDASTLVRATGDLQVRNRSTAASNAQVEDIAINLDPARLMPSVDADSGAPIVGRDNIIDSGNGRVQAIIRASQAYPARYNAYRKALEDAGYDLTGIETPVLINRRTTELSREARALFNQEANAPRAAQMSAVELAAMDGNALVDTMDVLDPSPVTSAGNRAFVQRFMANLAPSARGALVDGAGVLNADGVRRIENALIAAAYGDVDAGVLRRFAEATDDNTRAIVGAMSDVAGKWAQMRQAIKRGDISPEFDVTPELTEALRRIGQWREQAAREKRPVSVVIKEGMAQIDMLSGEISPEAQVMIGSFYQSNSFARAAGRETIADLLSRIVDATEELGRPQLFETADVGKLELLRNVAVNEQGNLFTPIGAVDGIEADGSLTRGVEATANRQGGGRDAVESGSITDRMTQRFSAAGRPADEARATAELVDAFYTQQADRLGISVDELEARFGLPEVRAGGEMGAAAMAQSPQSPAFREWFGDSKVVDEAGEPLVVYHGTPGAALEQFDPDAKGKTSVLFSVIDTHRQGFYFAEKEGFATGFAEQEGRRRGTVMPVYLSIRNPLDVTSTDNASVARLQAVADRMQEIDPEINNPDFIVGKAGYDDFWELLDTNEGGDVLVQAARDLGYDGIKMMEPDLETSDPNYVPDDVGAVTWVAFDNTQIKSVNNRGTFDPNDPRILNQSAASPNLVVQHNLSAANLLHADKMRGLAVPSLAISNVDYPLDGFGEITLIGGPDLIDPKADSASKVFDADVYSPRYPTVRYKVASKPYDKAWKRMDKASADLGHVLSGEIDHSEVERKGLEAFRDSSAVQLQFLRETGRDVELPQMTARTSYVAKVPEIADLVGQYDTPSEVMKNAEAVAAIGRALDMEIATVLDARGEGFTADEVRGWYYDKDGDIRRTVIDAIQQEIKISKRPGVDRSAARQLLRDEVKPYADEFAAWVDEQFSPVLASETIETQSASGDWKYMPHTLDNVVKVLRRKLRDGEGFNYGVASIRSNVANQFKSVAAIKAARGKLIPADAMAALKNETNDEFVALANVMEGYSKNKLGFGFLDAFSDHVKEVAERGVRALDQYYDGLPDAQKQAVVDFLDKLANMPTEYFEAKLQRAVDISEFKAAVIPNTADKATRDVLTYARVPVIEYDPKVPGSRAAAMRDVAGERELLFQGGDKPRGAIQLGDTNVISLFETADASTALHETGHMFLSMLKGMGEAADAPTDVRADWLAVRAWWEQNADAVAADANGSGRAEGVTGDDVRAAINEGTSGDAAKDRAIDVGMQEQWARGFEAYVREGNAPSPALARAFEQFKQWLTAIYRRATDLNVNLSPEIRAVFDNLLAPKKAEPELGLGDAAPARVTTSTLLPNDTPEVAAARVGKPDSIRETAMAHGVDPVTGDYAEMGDIAQIREEGRISPEDEAELAAADDMFENAQAYGRALDAAMRCLI